MNFPPVPSSTQSASQREPQSQSLTTTSDDPIARREVSPGNVDAVRYLRIARRSQTRARHRRWLGVFVGLLPFVATVVFIVFIGTPMYETSTRFAVRGGDAQQLSVTAFAGAGRGSASDALGAFVDGYAVRDYIQSRAGMREVSSKIDFASLAVRPDADPLVRLPPEPSEDMLFKAYSSMVKVNYNIFEQIVAAQCFGFSPDDAVKLCNAVIAVSESFADQMNKRAREDVLRVAGGEVSLAEQKALDARFALNHWRDENASVDPAAGAGMLLNLINQLETQRLTAQEQLAQIRASSPNSPRRASIERQVATLNDQIQQQQARLGSNAPDSSAGQIKEYETLKAAQDFADQNLINLRQSLEQARIQMIRQQRFVAVIAPPLPDEVPAYPAKFTPLLTSLIGGLALAFFGSVIIGMIRGILLA